MLFLMKFDYSGDLAALKEKHRVQKADKLKALKQYFEKIKAAGKLPERASPEALALALNCYMKGIVHEYLENPQEFQMRKNAHQLIEVFFSNPTMKML